MFTDQAHFMLMIFSVRSEDITEKIFREMHFKPLQLPTDFRNRVIFIQKIFSCFYTLLQKENVSTGTFHIALSLNHTQFEKKNLTRVFDILQRNNYPEYNITRIVNNYKQKHIFSTSLTTEGSSSAGTSSEHSYS